MASDQPKHIQHKKHADHKHIVKRLGEYIEAYRSRKPEAVMQFYHPDNFVYSDITADRHGMGHKEVEDQCATVFGSMHDLEIETLSVHGHKDFTAWEWEITCKPAISEETGEMVNKEDAPPSAPKRLVGCTLMWWEADKIIRNHDYVLMKEPSAG